VRLVLACEILVNDLDGSPTIASVVNVLVDEVISIFNLVLRLMDEEVDRLRKVLPETQL
jgi:hypothetical protein